MTRAHHLRFCKKCVNRQQNLQEGLVCNLTGEKASFEEECDSFGLDNTVVVKENIVSDIDHEANIVHLTEQELERYRTDQNYSKALTVGILVGLIGALLWGTITVATGYQIGYMAIAIGAGIGFAMRFIGKGIDPIFGITGGGIALLSCLLGNVFSIIGFVAAEEGLSVLETFFLFDYSLVFPLLQETFSPIDLLFYGIAAYAGFKYAFRVFNEDDLVK